VLYFVIASLSNIDPMYQYSLEYFIKIFKIRLEKAPNPPELEQRLIALITDMTEAFYTNICRGLFEKDKLLFSFLMAVNIKLEAREINAREWNFFLHGANQDIPLDEE
jgi:dynein heavy chain